MTDFHQAPFIVIWETTRACDLACAHCRAEAQPYRLPGELTRAEGLGLIDQIADMGTSVLVLSGGDPLKREDLLELIGHAKSRGLRVGTIPAASPSLHAEAVWRLKRAGLDQMALSLDASTADAHDRFRGVPGAFEKTLEAVAWAHAAELPLQINTVLTAGNFHELDEIIRLVSGLGIVFWEVFFLVPMGRGSALQGLSAPQYEDAFAKLYAVQQAGRFVLKVTEAAHYRRYVLQRQQQARAQQHAQGQAGIGAGAGARPDDPWRGHGPRGSIGLARWAINAGNGYAFISHTGEVYPSGFLPACTGSIRSTPLAELYRGHPVFRALRDPNALRGRCGVCEFRSVCGGSRSRAYAVSGDYLGEEPCCAYLPSMLRAAAAG